MLDIKQIQSFYPAHLKPYRRSLLREYLQFKILEAVYSSALGRGLVFMGGTAIHIVHGNPRFSEDLDFDNRGLGRSDFEALISAVATSLERQGYKVEVRTVFRTAFRTYLKFSDILFDSGISRHRNEKLNIQIDSEPQNFDYRPGMFVLNKFDVFQRIQIVPEDVLLAQKLDCVFLRPRKMGRDFFDIIFLLGKTNPNRSYLKQKIGIEDASDLKSGLKKIIEDISLEKLSKDIEPFLYNPADARKILQFGDVIETLDF